MMGTDSTSRTLVLLVALAVVAWCIWLIREILPPFLIAVALAFLLDPLLDRMERCGVPRGLAVALTFVVFLGAFFSVIAFLVPKAVSQVNDLLGNLDVYGTRVQQSVNRWTEENAALLQRMNLPANPRELWERYQGDIMGYVQGLLRQVFHGFQALAGTLGWLVIIPIVTLYLLNDLDPMRARLRHIIPDSHRDQVGDLAGKVGRVFSAYLRGLMMICAFYGLSVYLVLTGGFGLRYTLILALMAAVLYAVPYLGQLFLILGCCAVAWATGLKAGAIVGVAVSLVVVGQAFDQFITPRVIGRQVGLHPLIGLFALVVGGHLFGLAGMVFAVPVAASAKVVLAHLYPPLTEPLPGQEKPGRVPWWRGRKVNREPSPPSVDEEVTG
jgi:predicted PurR-regulated permease PerM